MPVRFALPVAAALIATCASVPTAAELYKWVDERGVTNYSNVPPAGQPSKPAPIENRVSVYTPDPMLAQAIEAERARAIEDLRTGRRQRELQQDWLARQYLAAVTAQAAAPCHDCAERDGFTYGFAGGRFPPRILPQAQLTPGVTAGNVTGSTGYIPGYSAFAPRMVHKPPRVVREGPKARPGGVGRVGARSHFRSR